MFGGASGASGKPESPTRESSSSSKERKSPSPDPKSVTSPLPTGAIKTTQQAASGEKRSGNGSPPGRQNPDTGNAADKKRRSSGISSKASSLVNAARNTLTRGSSRDNINSTGNKNESVALTPLQKLGKNDPALAVPQGSHNNSAGESVPGPRSTFRVGVWEDRNKKCRRTMEDTHAFLYNFLATPTPLVTAPAPTATDDGTSSDMVETDNGYFAIFDGHAGSMAADWCGKKLHIILEEVIRKHPNRPMPALIDESFCTADQELEKLPLKNSGCTAAVAVLRWEDRVPSTTCPTGSQPIAAALVTAAKLEDVKSDDAPAGNNRSESLTMARLKSAAIRSRVLYTANVGDARIVLCRDGKAVRLSYDHKGSDENEGKRIDAAGGLILNNRVNGVLAVTRALGDTYMKELVTGHPYTTETIILPEQDEFIIIACDGIWDVCTDQEAVDFVREHGEDPVSASKSLVDHALQRFSTDNLSCMIIRLDREALRDAHSQKTRIGVEGDEAAGKASEAEKIIQSAKQRMVSETGGASAGSGSGSNSNSHAEIDGNTTLAFKPTIIEGAVQEEPATMDAEDTPVVAASAAASLVAPAAVTTSNPKTAVAVAPRSEGKAGVAS